MDGVQSINQTTGQLETKLREQQARLNNLQAMLTTARKDSDLDLFCRRLQMTEIFSNIPPEAMNNLHLADFYPEFWKLAGESHRTTKFSAEEKNILSQILECAQQEKNLVRRQYFALLLILFGELQTARNLFDQNSWSPQLKKDFATFMNWNDLAYNPLSPQVRAKISRNDQILAFLKEKYFELIQKHSHAVINEKNCPRVRPEDYQIYFCWLQGEKNLPPIIRCCYNSLKQNAGHYKIVFIDEKNLFNYVDIAPHIMDKFRAGKISRTHFSDILRVNLLERHGGLWLDSTILVTEPLETHKDFWQLSYFTQRFHRDKSYHNAFPQNIAFGRWASNIQSTTILHHPLFVFEQEFYNKYWREFDNVIDYMLMDFMMALAFENIPVVQKNFDAIPINNVGVLNLQKHLNDSYSAYPFDKILTNNFLHKLSWKKSLDMTRSDTVFREIQRRYAPETIQK